MKSLNHALLVMALLALALTMTGCTINNYDGYHRYQSDYIVRDGMYIPKTGRQGKIYRFNRSQPVYSDTQIFIDRRGISGYGVSVTGNGSYSFTIK